MPHFTHYTTHLQGGEAECGVEVGHDVVIVRLGRREGVHVGGVGRGGAVLGIVRMYTRTCNWLYPGLTTLPSV